MDDRYSQVGSTRGHGGNPYHDPQSGRFTSGPNEKLSNDPKVNSRYIQLGDIISGGEGNYESYNSGTKGVNGKKVLHSSLFSPPGTVTEKTISEIIALSRFSGNDPRRMFAVGKYQITFKTLQDAVRVLNLDESKKFTPALQEEIFRKYLCTKIVRDWVSGVRVNVRDVQYAIARRWSSIGVPRGMRNKYGVISDGYLAYQDTISNTVNKAQTDKISNFLEK